MYFAFFDGDNIGPTLEILLLEGKVTEAISLSENLNKALTSLRSILKAMDGIEVMLLGGDDLLVKFDEHKHGLKLINQIREIYLTATGMTMSCGAGETITDSIRNLRLAKLYGKNQIRGLD